MQWQFWIVQTLNSVAFGGLLFLLSSGFSLAFGLMRIPNLAHGAFFMLGAYFGATVVYFGGNFWLAALAAGAGVGLVGIALERFILRPLAGNIQGQVLVTLGIAFIMADICLLVWTGDPWTVPAPPALRPPLLMGGFAFPTYRLVVVVIALVAAIALYFLMERTRLGAMIRAGVDDMEMARGVGIPVSMLFTVVFLLGAVLAGAAGAFGGPMLNAYPGLDADMLPLALIVVILGGAGSPAGRLHRQLRSRLSLQFRHRTVSRPRLLHPVPAHGAGARVHAAGLVRAGPAVNSHGLRGQRLAAAACLAVPWIITNDYYINLASQILIYALLALSLNLLLGYGGMVSLGHAAFLGLTGYSTILLVLAGYGQLTTAILSVVFSTACGALFGVLALRASGIGFLMITLALGQIVWGIAYRANELTGGDNGITLPARPAPFGIDINSASNFYYFTLIVFAIALFCIWRLTRSPFGAALCGTRDQPRRMSHARPQRMDGPVADVRDRVLLGLDLGLLYVYYNLFMSPHAISLQQSAEALLMAILGGASTLSGPIIGAAIITIVKNVVSTYVERWNTLLGLIFVLVIMFMPYGLVPGCAQLWRRLAAPRRQRGVRTGAQRAASGRAATPRTAHGFPASEPAQ